MRDTVVETLVEKLNAFLEARQEWVESHKDSGDGYSHLPREGGYAYGNGEGRLMDFLKAQDIDLGGLELEEVSEIALDSFRMEAGTLQDPSASDPDLFVLDSFTIGEIELQLEKTSFDPEASDEEWEEAKRQSQAFCKGNLAYLSSDRVWYAVIDAKTLRREIERATEPELEIDF